MMAHAVATAAAVVLGAAPALAASSSPYDAYDQTAYLAYLNAPEANGDLTRPPRLRISFGGGRSYDVVMDTGSTGIVVSADKIPRPRRLGAHRPRVRAAPPRRPPACRRRRGDSDAVAHGYYRRDHRSARP